MATTKKISSKVERISPTRAKALLAKSGPNRKPRDTIIRRYVQMMRAGEWVISQPIMIASTGKLIDGQHRLYAVIEYGKPVDFLVTRGLPESTFDAIDYNRPRTIADAFQICGEKNTTHLQTATYCYFVLSQSANMNGKTGTRGTWYLGPKSAEKIVRDNPQLKKCLDEMVKWNIFHLWSIGDAAGLYYACWQKNKKDAQIFFKQLATGENIGSKDITYKLRARLLANKTKRWQKMSRYTLLDLVIQGWNKYRGFRDANPVARKTARGKLTQIH